MAWNIVFEPLLPSGVLWLAAMASAFLILFSLWQRQRGSTWRGLTLAALILALANPSILEEERDPLKDIVAVVMDRSTSQQIGDRKSVSDAALAELQNELPAYKSLDIRNLTVTETRAQGDNGGTQLFTELKNGLLDVPSERIAGAIVITDGQIHDIPTQAKALGFDAPVHILLTGQKGERDRKLTIETAPRYGIVGERITLKVKVDDSATSEEESVPNKLANITVRVDGQETLTRRVLTGVSTRIEMELAHGGQNVIELEVDKAEDELTLQNNRAVVLVNGIRDHLRVLLVSGEPHAGERTWRNLLKADPSVDLVHFTILRPPEKQDGTPINELSLIEFPTRELFAVKLDEFDLIIFDRYKRRSVLPPLYFEHIARYVENGGALLAAAGPAFASPFSLFRTPLAAVLPAQPTGAVFTAGYRPEVTLTGHKHPVTAKLPGAPATPESDADTSEPIAQQPRWGRWFRLIESTPVSGETLMAGPQDKPLLVLDRIGEGRVAQLMSDHAWLWARGYEGGGPQAEILRRLAHWLMKEPDLEEEDLRATVRGQTIEISRRTMSDLAGTVTVTKPSGKTLTISPEETEPGLWRADVEADELGLYRINDLALSTVAGVGPLNPKELSDVRTTETLAGPFVETTGGGTFWIADKASVSFGQDVSLPSIRMVKPGRDTVGRSWMGLKQNNQYVVRSLTQSTLFIAPVALLLILGALIMGWYREGQ